MGVNARFRSETPSASNAFGLSQPDGRKNMSETTITARIRSDGTIVEVLKDGSERPFPATPMRPMTEAEIITAAVADPDAVGGSAGGLAAGDLSGQAKACPTTAVARSRLGLHGDFHRSGFGEGQARHVRRRVRHHGIARAV